VLVAETAKGISAVMMGDERSMLMADLRERFPAAQFVESAVAAGSEAADVLRMIDSPWSSAAGLRTDVSGTPFQREVWKALCDIPVGTTASYREIAARIGRPNSSRAVGQACAANPIAPLVPCHRALRSDGALSGYRWGIERKRALLDREANFA
jgi:AraC family transcriptional regulator of adaptative response/methylated-DNA-[protein]-cysteine methyltransferase